jgi:hypothetical protein
MAELYLDPYLGNYALAVDSEGMLWKVRYNTELPIGFTRIVDSAVYQPGTGALLTIFWHLKDCGGDNDSS